MKKKIFFTEKNKIFVKIIHIFYLKNIIIFQIVLLHLSNHTLLRKCEKGNLDTFVKMRMAGPKPLGVHVY